MVVGLVSPVGFSGVGFTGRGWLTLSVLLVRAGRSYGKLERGPRLGARVPFLLFMFCFYIQRLWTFESSLSSSSLQSLRSFGMYTPLYLLKCWLRLLRLAKCLIMFFSIGVFHLL